MRRDLIKERKADQTYPREEKEEERKRNTSESEGVKGKWTLVSHMHPTMVK